MPAPERPPAGTVWFTGLPASGKTTLARNVADQMAARDTPAHVVDGDELRHGLTSDLGFSREDRAESVRRAGELAIVLARAGVVPLVSLVSPYRAHRDLVRARHAEAGLVFREVFVDTPLEVCEQRDPKGLYAKARRGELSGMTGIDDPYEAPASPDLVIRPGDSEPNTEAVLRLILPG